MGNNKVKIGKLKLICHRKYSDVYEEFLDNKTYCLKVRRPSPNLAMKSIVESYKNYFNLKNRKGLVKVYDFWLKENTAYIRMEYLKDYISLVDWLKKNNNIERQKEVIIKILEIFFIMIKEGFIYLDYGYGNYMINKELKIKVIDLDILVKDRTQRLHWLGIGFLALLNNIK